MLITHVQFELNKKNRDKSITIQAFTLCETLFDFVVCVALINLTALCELENY